MRVLALVTEAFGGHGGIAEYNRQLLTALSKAPGVSEVIALSRFGLPASPLPEKIVQTSPSPSRAAWVLRSIQQVRSTKPDLIFCGHINAAPLAAALGKTTACPVWMQIHGIEAWSNRGGLLRRAMLTSSLVTSVSRYTRHRFLSWCDLAPELVRVLPNTYEIDRPVRGKRQNLLDRLNAKERKIILTVGRMSKSEQYKGHDRVIRCLSEVRRYVPEVIYVVVGGGDDRPRLEELAIQKGVADIIRFSGVAAAEDLPDYYALADVFAMPSTGEGFGIVFLEAAVKGVRVVAGNRDGSVDALAEGASGTMVDPDDEGALTAALVDGLLGRASGCPEAVKRFAFANFAHHVEKLTEGLLAEPLRRDQGLRGVSAHQDKKLC